MNKAHEGEIKHEWNQKNRFEYFALVGWLNQIWNKRKAKKRAHELLSMDSLCKKNTYYNNFQLYAWRKMAKVTLVDGQSMVKATFVFKWYVVSNSFYK